MSRESNRDKANAAVEYFIRLCERDNAAAARLRRADNPNTASQGWEYLARFVDIDRDYLLLPYALIAAAIAKAKISTNGTCGLGRAVASCYSEGNESDQAKSKLRRLLACQSVAEVCLILRPMLSLVHSKAKLEIDYAQLLAQLIRFNWHAEHIKATWAQEFYRP